MINLLFGDSVPEQAPHVAKAALNAAEQAALATGASPAAKAAATPPAGPTSHGVRDIKEREDLSVGHKKLFAAAGRKLEKRITGVVATSGRVAKLQADTDILKKHEYPLA